MASPQNFTSISRRPPDVEDYIDMLRRYRSWIVGPMFAGLVVAVVVAFVWPDTYISSAVMRITPQQVPERLVPSAVSTQMAERLTSMQQEILSRSSLSELIQRPALDLYKKERGRKPMEDVVEDMRKAVKITILDVATTQRRNASAFQIQFSYVDRYKAQAVVRDLVTKFTEQNVQVLRNQATLTTSFLNDEMKSSKEELDRIDTDIARFKTENAGKLPEQLQSNIGSLNALQMQLANASEALNRNQQEKMILETQLQNLRNQAVYYAANAEETVTTAGAQSAVALVGYLIAHAPGAYFLTLVTFCFALVPIVGAGAFSFAVAVYLYLLGHLYPSIFLAVWSVFVVGVVDNIVKPMVIKGGMEMHGAIVFFALIGGFAAFGLVGLVLGPLSVTLLLAVLRIYQRDFTVRESAPGGFSG